MKEYNLLITFACDWQCPYCIVDTHAPGKGMVPLAVIKEKIAKVEDGSLITLSGGEPGLAKREIMDYAMKTLKEKNCSIMINTNGQFFKRYPEYVKDIKEFVYHCSDSLDLDEDIYIPEADNVRYLIVVTDATMDRLEPFLDKYSNICFHVSAAADTSMYSVLPQRHCLSKMNALKIVMKYKDRILPSSLDYLFNKCSDVKESIDL